MARRRTLSGAELAAVRGAGRLTNAQRRALAEQIDVETFDRWQGWVWGRESFDLLAAIPDAPPARAVRVLDLSAIEYVARKRDDDGKARRAVYRHEHDGPHFPIVATTEPGARAMLGERAAAPNVSTRGVAWRGPALFVLGELYALEGAGPDGTIYTWRAPRGWLLCGCPVTDSMHVVRRGAQRNAHPPIWIVRGRSRYTITDRGIEH